MMSVKSARAGANTIGTEARQLNALPDVTHAGLALAVNGGAYCRLCRNLLCSLLLLLVKAQLCLRDLVYTVLYTKNAQPACMSMQCNKLRE